MNSTSSQSNPKVRKGSCRCGQLTFSVTGPRMFSTYCHCRNCRKGTSAPFSLLIGIPLQNFQWTSAENHSSSPNNNLETTNVKKVVNLSDKFEGYYCSECGGYVAQRPLHAPFISTMASCYEEMKKAFCPLEMIQNEEKQEETFFQPERHINYENRVCEVKDELPKFMDFPLPVGSGRMYIEQQVIKK